MDDLLEFRENKFKLNNVYILLIFRYMYVKLYF